MSGMQLWYHIIDMLRDFNIISVIVRIVLAILLSSILGLERSKSGRAAGLRTHILVCLGACIAAMTGVYINQYYGGDPSRIAAQVVSGIGFLGTGTILIRNKSAIVGLTTAAGVWVTGAIGIAIGYGFYEAALISSLLSFLIIDKFNKLEKKFKPNGRVFTAYIEFIDAQKINDTIVELLDAGIVLSDTAFTKVKTNLPEGLAANTTITVEKNKTTKEAMEFINNHTNVSFAAITT